MTVARDEAERYLQMMVCSAAAAVDELFVFDDQSADNTVDMCRTLGCTVAVRADTAPSFADSEGGFRQAAWDAFEAAMAPAPGDWVLSIDADELIAGRYTGQLRDVVAEATEAEMTGVRLPVPEVWGFKSIALSSDGGRDWTQVWTRVTPQVRVDGEWGRQRHCRLFAYQPGGRFVRRVKGRECVVGMASGHHPDYVNPLHPELASQNGLALLHLGYLNAADRQAKYERYSRIAGHSPWHLRSILQPPVLADWAGQQPFGGWQ